MERMDADNSPSPNGDNGHDPATGQFTPGNAGGPGNPHGRRVARLRALLAEAVTDGDLRAIVGKLVDRAKAGELAAIRELLDRIIGRPTPAPPEPPEPTPFDRARDAARVEASARVEAMFRQMFESPERATQPPRPLAAGPGAG